MKLADLNSFLASYPGGVSIEEGLALSQYAEQCLNNVIVEIGSFKGKSAVALASGQALGCFAETGLVYCVEPHLPFTGLYGGVFGAQDRRDFYAIMLETGFVERVCLINLRSDVAAKGWKQPIGLLFIDGDHTLEGVRSDISAWEGHLTTGGIIIFDDAADPAAGAYHVIKDLMKCGRFEWRDSVGKLVALRKIISTPSVTNQGSKRILVACHEMVVAGGLYRFERFGRVVQRFGHQVVFVAFGEMPQRDRGTELPVLSFKEAMQATWDVTIVPGAGFPESTIMQLQISLCRALACVFNIYSMIRREGQVFST
jgi:predicted O-methyltransferase YrrM